MHIAEIIRIIIRGLEILSCVHPFYLIKARQIYFAGAAFCLSRICSLVIILTRFEIEYYLEITDIHFKLRIVLQQTV